MTRVPDVFRTPSNLTDGPTFINWFDRIAILLLHDATLKVAGKPHRLTEVEFYYHGGVHCDPFAHRDPVQLACGRWYFHRTGGVYRAGSFKGLDLTFGTPQAHAGILFRGLETAEGQLIDGPSLLVDHLLRSVGMSSVASLDAAIGGRIAWEPSGLLELELRTGAGPTIYRAPRVGLSLKRSSGREDMNRFIMRPYRYLTEPRRIAKGKPHLVLSLYASGVPPEEIRRLTGCPAAALDRYITDYEAGRTLAKLDPFHGIDLGPREFCRLVGAWNTLYGTVASPLTALETPAGPG